MPRILFTCAYDGAAWRGWQSQRNGRTIQDCLQSAFAGVLGRPLRIVSAGRTDAGVHAFGQCFHADVPETCRMNPRAWVAALNAHLSTSVRILAAERVSADFHARYSALGKVYEYRICCGPILLPHDVGRVWHCREQPNMQLLKVAMNSYCGRHDFRAFAARRGNEPDPLPAGYFCREVYDARVEIQPNPDYICVHVHGNGFLYHMVRLMVGSAWRVAIGRLSLGELQRALADTDAPHSRYCAPAAGLYLMRVLYPTTVFCAGATPASNVTGETTCRGSAGSYVFYSQ